MPSSLTLRPRGSEPAALGAPAPVHPAVAVSRVPRWTTPLDVVTAVALAGWGLVEVLVIPELRGPGGAAFALASTLPLVLRRRFPITVTVVICAVLVVQAAAGGAGASFTPFPGLLVAAFTVAAQVAPLPLAAAGGALPVAAMLAASRLGFFGDPGIDARGALVLVFFVGGAWTGGRLVRHRALAVLEAEQHRADAEQRAQDAQDATRDATRDAAAQAAAQAAQAVEAERARIARELHDVVAHAVSVVVLQAGAAEQFLDRDVERSRHHLELTRRTAVEAMNEMRHLLAVLREDGAGYVPQPGIDRIADLVADARSAGLPVTLATAGTADVPDGPSLAAYRVVQESLTNVLRHAPGAVTRVRVALDDGDLVIEVDNEAPARSGRPDPGGHGLVGMAERVRVYGGALEAGPAPGGGWSVRARLPLGAA